MFIIKKRNELMLSKKITSKQTGTNVRIKRIRQVDYEWTDNFTKVHLALLKIMLYAIIFI